MRENLLGEEEPMTKQPAIGLVMGSAIAPEQLISGARIAESVGFEEIVPPLLERAGISCRGVRK